MEGRRHVIVPVLQPAFVICALVLAVAGAGMSTVTSSLGLCLRNEPLALVKPLDALDEDKLIPYSVVAKYAIENEDVLKSLGTEDYIQWVLEDPREPAQSPVRNVLVFLTYYGLADRVPHVPEECYTGGGYKRLATDTVDLDVALSDGPRAIAGRYLVFDRAMGGSPAALRRFPVLYLFRVNGQYAGSRNEARIALNKSLFSKHAYFCKVELVFNQSPAAPTKAEVVTASEKVLAVLLPLLEEEHWPDRD